MSSFAIKSNFEKVKFIRSVHLIKTYAKFKTIKIARKQIICITSSRVPFPIKVIRTVYLYNLHKWNRSNHFGDLNLLDMNVSDSFWNKFLNKGLASYFKNASSKSLARDDSKELSHGRDELKKFQMHINFRMHKNLWNVIRQSISSITW